MKNIHQQTFQECSHRLVGLPYFSFDCWDLVRLFHHMIYQVELVDYKYQDPNDTGNISSIINSEKEKYTEVFRPEFGDIMLLRIHGLGAHVGIFIDNRSFLHTTEKTGSIIDKTYNWKDKILGYYRYAKD